MAFEKYRNTQTNSGVTAFELHKEQISVLFDNMVYIYTYPVTGRKHVDEMKRLAKKGKGLSTYISQNVKEKYQEKYPFNKNK